MNFSADPFLEAETIGFDVPPGRFPVEVHSVFSSAINLQPRSGGNLITILGRSSTDYPQGIRLASAEDFLSLGLTSACTGQVHEHGISLDRPGGAAPLRVSFATAQRLPVLLLPFIQQLGASWKTGIAQLRRLQTQADTELRIHSLLGQDPAQGRLGQRLAQAALELAALELAGSVRAGALNAASKAISRLVGLGPGLTPSGDDFLGGFIAAAHCRLREGSNSVQFLRELNSAILANLSKTTAISATFLRCATAGKVSQALHEVAQALQRDAHCGAPLLRLCTLGHSSGMDIATGFLFGLTVWD